MKRILSLLAIILAMLTVSLVITSCDEGDTTDANSGKTITLNVYNWGEYISDGFQGSLDVNAAFEEYFYEKFGYRVIVNYTTYATNEDMYSKLKSGAGTYDIVVPSDYMIQKMISEGMLYAFDATTIENYKYVSDSFKNTYFDEDNMYSVPYTYGMTGIIYNNTMVDEEDVAEQSWSLLWNEKYKGKILQFNNPRDAFGTAMYYMGLDINSTNNADWDLALNKLIEQKPLVQAYVNDEIFNKMTSGSASIATYFVGDYITMLDSNENLSFYYPKEGVNVFVDAMCIPANAQNKEIAKEYINFMLSEEAAVANAVYIGYASPNTLVADPDAGYFNENYAEEIGEDAIETLYMASAEQINVNYPFDPYYHSFSQDIQDYTNTLWENLKTEDSIETWIHVTSATIIVGLIAAVGYNTYIKKKRSRDYRTRDKALGRNKA